MEEIIIDGVDVSECDDFREGYCHPDTGVCYKCDTNCQYAAFYLKEQLARKTAECEELKVKQNILKEAYIKRLKEWYHLKQALDEIKDLLFQVTHADFDDEYKRAYQDLQNNFRITQKQILEIINKAKDANNE